MLLMDPLDDFRGGKVSADLAHFIKDRNALRCHSEAVWKLAADVFEICLSHNFLIMIPN